MKLATVILPLEGAPTQFFMYFQQSLTTRRSMSKLMG